MIYFCCDERRRELVRKHETLNGIDFLEVLDNAAPSEEERQRTLFVHFIKPLPAPPDDLKKENIRIEGGERIRDVSVTNAFVDAAGPAHVLTVKVNKPGDFSTYTLRLATEAPDSQRLKNFDPRLSAIDFSFKVECPSEFDCQTTRVCAPEPRAEPEINYLAKDYASFRQLMLDRLAALMPQWRERNPADLGIALVEVLAYVGDYLSYQQDAVATEAYLGTARRRVSVRRHARLVDYAMHDGSNARVWAHVEVEETAENIELPAGAQLLTPVAGQENRIEPDSRAYDQALAARPEFFETMREALLFGAHKKLRFYTWGDERCCLPRGATRATLCDDATNRVRLRAGDVLIFEERLGPTKGNEADADPTRRQAVRLTRAHPEAQPVLQAGKEVGRTPGDLVTDPLTLQPIVEIEWHAQDALAFPLCISALHDGNVVEDVSVALGNIVLADHGLTVESESLGVVPEPTLFLVAAPSADRCQPEERKPVLPRFRPRLSKGPLTQAATVAKTDPETGERLPFDPEAPASTAFQWSMADVFPAISLDDDRSDKTWRPRRDLLSSDRFATEFVAEVEADGSTTLRFGDDRHGLRPEGGTCFSAVYRVGNGLRGNVGAETIAHIVIAETAVKGVRNPLPARGGVDAESIEQARQSAPFAFRTQERAVTQEDYAAVAERHPGAQRAAATFRWTGSWRTVFVTADRVGGLPVDDLFELEMRGHLERFRMAGYDLEVDGPPSLRRGAGHGGCGLGRDQNVSATGRRQSRRHRSRIP